MAKTIILGNNPQNYWIKDLEGVSILPVPNITFNNSYAIVDYVNSLPKDIEWLVIDADSLNAENTELPLAIAMYVRLMLHSCLKTSLSQISIVTDLMDINTYKGYGAFSVLLMTQKTDVIKGNEVKDMMTISASMTPSEYVEGFVNLIKIEPQEKVEGRHSIANEWGAEALYNVISGEVKSNIITGKVSSSLYFKYSAIAVLNAEDVRLVIDGRTPKFLTKKARIYEDARYLLIDDEADKGWDKVLRSLMPNAKQEVWGKSINSYEEISEEIRHKISDGYYDLVFLDLRMSGVAEENIFKPEDFSGMKILEAIKKVNSGIQVIMLTATNKAWNLKALIDAGANGYYMKESPEYHFTFRYSEQNALALVDTIKGCLDNSYLQDIVAQQKRLALPSDSELSDNILNQISIAVSLILKAKTETEYAFAYISLEQVFEIISEFLIRQESNGCKVSYYFTEDTQEQCRLYKSGLRQGFMESSPNGKSVALWKKIAAIYYQLYGGEDSSFSSKVEDLISLRNQYIHPSNGFKPKITSVNFKNLFETIIELLSLFR